MTEALAYLLLAQLQTMEKPWRHKVVVFRWRPWFWVKVFSCIVRGSCFQLHATGDFIEVLGCGWSVWKKQACEPIRLCLAARNDLDNLRDSYQSHWKAKRNMQWICIISLSSIYCRTSWIKNIVVSCVVCFVSLYTFDFSRSAYLNLKSNRPHVVDYISTLIQMDLRTSISFP